MLLWVKTQVPTKNPHTMCEDLKEQINDGYDPSSGLCWLWGTTKEQSRN